MTTLQIAFQRTKHLGLNLCRMGLIWVALAAPPMCFAGSGTTSLGVCDPQAENGISTQTAAAVADSYSNWIQHLIEREEIYEIELWTRDAMTSAALTTLGTRAPQWRGKYTPAWIRMLNSNELISYAALGTISSQGHARTTGRSNQTTPPVSVRYEIWDFVWNHRVGVARASGTDYDRMGRELAEQTIRMLQLTFSTVTEVDGENMLINIGPEAVTTGDLLLMYAHEEYGPHPPGYPYHEHKEELDHYRGSRIYERFIREAQRGYGVPGKNGVPIPPKSFPHYKPGASLFALARRELAETSRTLALKARDSATSTPGSIQREVWEHLSHEFDGNPVGLVRIEGFLQPRPYYQHFIAEARVVKGIALPGSFLRLERHKSR